MKKAHRLPLIFIAALFALALALFFGISANSGLAASADTDYEPDTRQTYVKSYAIECDIKSNRAIAVTETIEVYYYNNRGFFRDIPVNAGEIVKNVNVTRTDKPSVYSDVTYEDGFIVVEIDDNRIKIGETYTYVLTYDYLLTSAQEGENILAFNPLGTGIEKAVYNVDITVKLPESYKAGKCYAGLAGSTNEYLFDVTNDGSGIITLTTSFYYLAPRNGVTLYLEFEDGALSTYFDFTPYIFIIAGAVLLLIIIALKFLCFNKNTLTPVVNFEAPNDMTPLVMGKLIDNKVNSEDVTAMIFYFADKGWLKINLDDENDPVLIRMVRQLPASCEDYERLMFANLFGNEDAVRTSSLTYRFYRTVEKVTAIVNAKTKGLYSGTSLGVSILFALFGALLMGVAPLLIAFTQISAKFIVLAPFITLMPALFIYAITETIKYYSLKWKPRTKALFGLIVAAICAVLTGAYMLFLPNAIMGYLPKALICIVSCLCIVCSVLLIGRTKNYNEELNQIVGFKNFITLAEKDRLEKLLEKDPQIYYHILPYAQVLGVSDKWEEKFANITIAPPEWVTGSTAHTLIEFHMINRIIHTSTTMMSNTFHSRPSSSSGSGFGGFGGGGRSGGGGHVGGGHGGGGMRFK